MSCSDSPTLLIFLNKPVVSQDETAFLSVPSNAKLPYHFPYLQSPVLHPPWCFFDVVTPFSLSRAGLWLHWGTCGDGAGPRCTALLQSAVLRASSSSLSGGNLLGQPAKTEAKPSSGPLGVSMHILSTDLSYLSRTS